MKLNFHRTPPLGMLETVAIQSSEKMYRISHVLSTALVPNSEIMRKCFIKLVGNSMDSHEVNFVLFIKIRSIIWRKDYFQNGASDYKIESSGLDGRQGNVDNTDSSISFPNSVRFSLSFLIKINNTTLMNLKELIYMIE
ncbi:hypothetical protein TNCT_327031 [Trichonephila clavata]|uniref:Uncharacterized protein n=1 Tax=Trichonephila clavata TaxID=2740835 RepID=A0A8X6GVQ0_TRICU|nr:hypothetical protein TNCT_327031 [Trichonephila clavata]